MSATAPRGRLISFEGGDGVGKSTQAHLLMERLRKAGADVVHLREPGGTDLGEEVRRLVKGAADPTPRAELLLFEAARAELVERVMKPALDSGRVVVTDRFADSSLAYQGYGRGLDLEDIRTLNQFATAGLTPDLTVLVDLPADEGARRASHRDTGASGGHGVNTSAEGRRFELEQEHFHRRVAQGFRSLAATEPERWLVVDGTQPAEKVAQVVWQRVAALLKVPGQDRQ